MSFHTFFTFTAGLAKPLKAPVGTLENVKAHVAHVEETLGLRRTANGEGDDHLPYWDYDTRPDGRSPGCDANDVVCREVSAHNKWVRRFYFDLGDWAENPPPQHEIITEADAKTFWHGLQTLTVPPERWTREYYVERMEHLYEVMRGREDEGVTFGAKALTSAQAAAVVRIFDSYLDKDDMRLDVPHGHDYLASSYDGGYDWCGTCSRAMKWEDAQACRRRKCELREDNE